MTHAQCEATLPGNILGSRQTVVDLTISEVVVVQILPWQGMAKIHAVAGMKADKWYARLYPDSLQKL